MRDPKRARTQPPASSSSRHASPFRSPTRSPSPSRAGASPKRKFQSLNLLKASEPPLIPAGLFSDRVTSIAASPYCRSLNNRARYFLFKNISPSYRPASSASSPTKLPKAPPRPTAPMLNYVQVLTTPTADTPGTCLLVHHDNRRYLFGNISEGTQRVFVQQKVSMSRAEEIFMTGPVNWHTAGGLLGMILTVAEVVQSARAASLEDATAKVAKLKKAGNKGADTAAARAEAAAAAVASAAPKSLSIHGGTNLAYLLATARRFVFRKGLPIRPHEVREDNSQAETGGPFRDPDWSDENMMVWYVPVFAKGGSASTSKPDSSSRKRSFEDVEGRQDADEKDSAKTTLEEQHKIDRQLVDSVVKHMFDSDWKLDALIETTLHAAKLPAKLFVKDDSGHLKVYDGPLPGDRPDVPDVTVFVRQPWPGALIQALPHTSPVRQSMCYIVRNQPRRGKVNAAEVARLGVAKRDIRLLVDGQNVTAADGSTVTREMVVGATVEGAAFAVVDLPDVSYIDAFLAKPEWANTHIMSAINTIFWILGPGVAADERLRAFMHKHGAIRHSISSSDVCANQLALASAAAVQLKHNRVDHDRFPIQQFNNSAPETLPRREGDDRTSPIIEAALPGWTIRLAPQVLVEEQKVFPPLDFAASLDQLDPDVIKLAEAARAQIAKPAFQAAVTATNRELPRSDVEVIPLGTGSAMPSKYRNVSATLVRVPGVGSYLLDCGENTLGSMRRLLGDAKLDEVLQELRVVWISHLHADHHLGTVSVIRAWRDATAKAAATAARTPRLMVASHVNMLHWLREYAQVEDFGLGRLHQVELDCPDFPRSRICTPVVFGGAEAAEFGLERIDACRVEHCHGALAVVFTWLKAAGESGALKVAYSGDCRPSADFVEIGRGSTLLLHESTFDDELAGEALAKKHSTMGEALDVGRRMGARRVLLTHFSQRYPKIPIFNSPEEAAEATRPDADGVDREMQVLVAFDHMRVRLADFKTAAAFLPAFQKLYEGEEKH